MTFAVARQFANVHVQHLNLHDPFGVSIARRREHSKATHVVSAQSLADMTVQNPLQWKMKMLSSILGLMKQLTDKIE